MALTNGDLKAIGNLVGVVLDEKIEEKGLVTKDDLKYLPTKEEFYSQTDKMMKELRDMREEKTVQGGQISDIYDKIDALEGIHPGGVHVSI